MVRVARMCDFVSSMNLNSDFRKLLYLYVRIKLTKKKFRAVGIHLSKFENSH